MDKRRTPRRTPRLDPEPLIPQLPIDTCPDPSDARSCHHPAWWARLGAFLVRWLALTSGARPYAYGEPAHGQVVRAAWKAHPDDVLAFIAHVRAKGTLQHYLLALCEATQYEAHLLPSDPDVPYRMHRGQLDLLWRGVAALASDLQPGLPEDVYGYLLENLEGCALGVLGHARRRRAAAVQALPIGPWAGFEDGA
jgi:hypothetical protein